MSWNKDMQQAREAVTAAVEVCRHHIAYSDPDLTHAEREQQRRESVALANARERYYRVQVAMPVS